VIGVCFFSVSDHPTFWGEFNAWYAPRFLDGIKQGFDRMTILPSQPTPVYNPYTPGFYTLSGNGVRARAKAGTGEPILATFNSGDRVHVTSNSIAVADGYGWQIVQLDDGKLGAMALHGPAVTWSLSPEPVTPQPEPVTREQLTAWADTLQTVVDDMRAKAATL
jgi:hypothetical protein